MCRLNRAILPKNIKGRLIQASSIRCGKDLPLTGILFLFTLNKTTRIDNPTEKTSTKMYIFKKNTESQWGLDPSCGNQLTFMDT